MAEKCIELDSVEIAAAVFGNCDRNIRLLEKEFSVTAVCRGTQLRISGEPANVAAANRAVEGMLLLIENRTPLEDQTVHYCISLAHDGAEKRVKELTEDFVTVTVKGRPIRPKTLGQKEYLSAIRSNAITFGVGPAGTGKTYLAVAMAVKAFKAKEVSRIILTRPAVEAGEKLGFLPESQNDMIFAIICEELGLFGAVSIILIFLFMIYRFMIIANNAPDLFGALLVVGVMGHIAIQVILNIAVVTNTIPNTGITLPFISYGGTSVLFLLMEMGIVLSVSNQIKLEK